MTPFIFNFFFFFFFWGGGGCSIFLSLCLLDLHDQTRLATSLQIGIKEKVLAFKF